MTVFDFITFQKRTVIVVSNKQSAVFLRTAGFEPAPGSPPDLYQVRLPVSPGHTQLLSALLSVFPGVGPGFSARSDRAKDRPSKAIPFDKSIITGFPRICLCGQKPFSFPLFDGMPDDQGIIKTPRQDPEIIKSLKKAVYFSKGTDNRRDPRCAIPGRRSRDNYFKGRYADDEKSFSRC